jgi:hypothetical protein
MNYPFIEQQVWTFVILIRLEYVFGQNVRNKLVVDTNPGLTWLLAHVPVRMKNIKGVVSTGGRQAVMIQNCQKVVK